MARSGPTPEPQSLRSVVATPSERGRRRCRGWSCLNVSDVSIAMKGLASARWPSGTELLFQVITEREEKASIAVASNAPFSEWGQTFTDPRLAAAVVDRLTFNALIIQTGTDSYRLRATRHAKKGGAPAS